MARIRYTLLILLLVASALCLREEGAHAQFISVLNTAKTLYDGYSVTKNAGSAWDKVKAKEAALLIPLANESVIQIVVGRNTYYYVKQSSHSGWLDHDVIAKAVPDGSRSRWVLADQRDVTEIADALRGTIQAMGGKLPTMMQSYATLILDYEEFYRRLRDSGKDYSDLLQRCFKLPSGAGGADAIGDVLDGLSQAYDRVRSSTGTAGSGGMSNSGGGSGSSNRNSDAVKDRTFLNDFASTQLGRLLDKIVTPDRENRGDQGSVSALVPSSSSGTDVTGAAGGGSTTGQDVATYSPQAYNSRADSTAQGVLGRNEMDAGRGSDIPIPNGSSGGGETYSDSKSETSSAEVAGSSSGFLAANGLLPDAVALGPVDGQARDEDGSSGQAVAVGTSSQPEYPSTTGQSIGQGVSGGSWTGGGTESAAGAYSGNAADAGTDGAGFRPGEKEREQFNQVFQGYRQADSDEMAPVDNTGGEGKSVGNAGDEAPQIVEQEASPSEGNAIGEIQELPEVSMPSPESVDMDSLPSLETTVTDPSASEASGKGDESGETTPASEKGFAGKSSVNGSADVALPEMLLARNDVRSGDKVSGPGAFAKRGVNKLKSVVQLHPVVEEAIRFLWDVAKRSAAMEAEKAKGNTVRAFKMFGKLCAEAMQHRQKLYEIDPSNNQWALEDRLDDFVIWELKVPTGLKEQSCFDFSSPPTGASRIASK